MYGDKFDIIFIVEWDSLLWFVDFYLSESF